jgi:hypothetical protein
VKGFPHGPVLVTVFINGIWSQAAYLVVEKYDPQKQVKNLKAKTMKTLYPLIPDLQTTRRLLRAPQHTGPDRD